jgi:hypothetical protein
MKMAKMINKTNTIGYMILMCLIFCLFQSHLTLAKDTPRSGQATVKKGPIIIKKQGKEREPFEVSPEYMRSQRIEIPEIVVRGVMKGRGKTVAIAEIDLDYEKGVSLLQAGDRVSIEARGGSRSGKGSIYFIVRSVSRAGICIELENGEKVWYPTMGKE